MTEQIRFEGEELPRSKNAIDEARDTTCCFTGHRDIPQISDIYSLVREAIVNAYDSGYRNFCAGGAKGFDTIAALNTLALRETEYSDIKLILILPYKDQHLYWEKESRSVYETILEKADSVEYVSDKYHKWCLFERNRRLVKRSSRCICYLTQEKSGTSYTVDLAKKDGLSIINLAKI